MRSQLLPSLILSAALAACGASAADFAFTRTSTNDAPDEALVTLAITFEGTGICQAVEERLPGTLTAEGAPSAEGVVLADSRTLRWGPFDLPASTTLTYRVTGRAGSHAVEGTVWMDGHAVFGLTGTSVIVGSALPAPATTPPPQVATPTLDPAGATALPVSVTVSCATAGATLRYTLDGSLPTASSALVEGAITISADTLLRVRGFKDGMTPSRAAYGVYATPPIQSEGVVDFHRTVVGQNGASPTIVVRATVLSGDAISYSVTETLAAGLTPSAITESGVWDDSDRSIRWGPFDDRQSRALTYRVSDTINAQAVYALQGIVSVNGRSDSIAGADVVELLSGTGWAGEPQPPHEASRISRAPTLTWSNPADTVYNAVYFSTNSVAVAAMDALARVRFDGSTAWNAYQPGSLLIPGTVYFWRIVEFDAQGEFSAGGPVWSFTVKPFDYGVVLSEGFEHGGAMPSGWSQAYVWNSYSWTFQNGGYSGNPAAAHSGSYNALFFRWGGATTRLMTPPLNLTHDNMRLSFWHTQPKWSTPDRLSVYYKTSADGVWTLIPGASFTAEVPVWTQRVFDLPEASATYYIAFEARSESGYGVCIDDVAVYPALTALGTPYEWLTQYNLTDGDLTFDEAEALDSDGDSFFNWQEFIAGTDPTNAASAFRILGVDPGPPVTVTFEPATPARDYTLQYVDDLVNGVWRDVPGQGPRSGGDGVDAMEDVGDAPARFYRIRVELP